MILDAHAHLFHPAWYPARFTEYLMQDFARSMQSRTGRLCSPAQAAGAIRCMIDRTGELTLRVMDQAGIDRRVILVVDWGLELGEAELSLAAIHKEILGVCARSNGRLIGFAGVDPTRGGAADIVRRAFDDFEARGLKLHPTGSWTLDDDRTHEVVSIAADRRLPVLVHIGRTMTILKDENAQPDALCRLARAFPHAAFIAGHCGFERFEMFLNEIDAPPNIYFDISGWQDMVRTRNCALAQELPRILRAFPNRVCYGTDSPFFSCNLASREKWWLDTVKAVAASCPYDICQDALSLLPGPSGLRRAIRVN